MPEVEDVDLYPAGCSWQGELVTIVGSGFAGKTHYLQHLFRRIYPHFHYGIVFSGTDKITSEYGWMPEANRYDTWETQLNAHGATKIGFKYIMEKVLALQDKNIRTMGAENCPRIFIIIDDCFGSINFHKEPIFQVVAGQLRKYYITMFVVVQYVKYLSPMLRAASRKLLIFNNTEEDLMKIKELTIGFRTKAVWLDFIIAHTKDFRGVFYDRVARRFYLFKAPSHPTLFRLSFTRPKAIS